MNKVLIIENLPTDKGSSEVTELLAPLGKVNWVYVQGERAGRNSKTAYVEMGSQQEAAQAIVKWNGVEWAERVLRVKYVDANFDPNATISGDSWPQLTPPENFPKMNVEPQIAVIGTPEHNINWYVVIVVIALVTLGFTIYKLMW
ncbi:MAG: RNA-binding protein [Acidobacteriota bacterium]